MTRHSDDDLDTGAPPPPRRSDDAFARAVAADIDTVKAARTRWPWLALGPLTATAAALAFTFTTSSTPVDTTSPAPPTVTSVAIGDVNSSDDDDNDDDDLDVVDLDGALASADDRTLLALADPTDDAEITGDDFSFSGLLGSSDQELAAVEAALDTALRRL
jgi:hypothetical protein